MASTPCRGAILSIDLLAGPESVVNTTTAFEQIQTDIVGLSDGGYVIVWASFDPFGSTPSTLYAQRYTADGQPVGAESQINATGTSARYPSVAATDDGGYAVAYLITDADINHAEIQRFDSAGDAVGAPIVVAASGNNIHEPSLTGIAGGGYAVSWMAYVEGVNQVFVQIYDAAGQAVGPELLTPQDWQPAVGKDGELLDFLVRTWQEAASVTGLADGGFIVTWTSDTGHSAAIFTQRWDANGQTAGAVRITDYGELTRSIVVAMPDGGYVIAGNVGRENVHEIFSQRFAADGSPLHGPTYIGGLLGSGLQAVAVAAITDGGYEFAWTDGTGTHNQRVGDDGERVGGVERITAPDEWGEGLVVSGLAFGGFVAAFGVRNPSDGFTDVYMRAYLPSGDHLTGTPEADTLQGVAGSDWVQGLAGDDRIGGGGGDDYLDGGTGNDSMDGGLGDDIFIVDSAGDVVIDRAGQGHDTVEASVSFRMNVAFVEDLVLTGNADINGVGNLLDNMIIGNAGNNLLDGGEGQDVLKGGAGNDTYVVVVGEDVVVETNGKAGGTDTILLYGAVTGDEAWLESIENITLMSAGDADLFGNGLANILRGNDGRNVIDGRWGADAMIGGGGDDTYYVDDTGDRIVEAVGGGVDQVRSSVTFNSFGQEIEVITLTGWDTINAVGNAANNSITGNDGDNSLYGQDGNDVLRGGAGNDRLWGGNGLDILWGGDGNDSLRGSAGVVMRGGTGNDVYFVSDASDTLGEYAGEGVDLVNATISLTLSANVENLILRGTGNTTGVGNDLANIIIGNDGNNLIRGRGGADRLTGGLGADLFVFDDVANQAVITDFSAGQGDRIHLNAISHGVANGGGITVLQVGNDTVIDLGGGSIITVQTTLVADLTGHVIW